MVLRRAHEVSVAGVESPEVEFLLQQGCCVPLIEDSAPHALGASSGARGEVHGAGQWPGCEVDGCRLRQCYECLVVHDQCGVGVVEQKGSLGGQ